MASSSHPKTYVSTKIHHPWSRFGVWRPWCSCMSSHSTAPNWEWTLWQNVSAVPSLSHSWQKWPRTGGKCPHPIRCYSPLGRHCQQCSSVLRLDSVITPYFPSLNLCDYDLVPEMKQPVHRKLFSNKDDILTAVPQEVAPISVRWYQWCFLLSPSLAMNCQQPRTLLWR
jgi:hypothetical protein